MAKKGRQTEKLSGLEIFL